MVSDGRWSSHCLRTVWHVAASPDGQLGVPLTTRVPFAVGGLFGSHVTWTSHPVEPEMNWNPAAHCLLLDAGQPPALLNPWLTSTSVTVTTAPAGREAFMTSEKQ